MNSIKLEHVVPTLTQLFHHTPRPIKFGLIFAFVLAIPLLPRPSPRPRLLPLPPGVERVYVKAGDEKGQLELLVARPGVATHNNQGYPKAPLLFIHGIYGSASAWNHWTRYFASQGRTVYALSLSGHGYSTRPSFYTFKLNPYFAKDVLVALDYIVSTNKDSGMPPPVLVGHSAGGGLAQYVMDVHGAKLQERKHIGGLICVSPIPPQGGLAVLINWSLTDRWFPLRMFINPYLLLSTPQRVSRIFFGQHYCHSLHPTSHHSLEKADRVPDGFMENMSKEESVAWPMGMNYPFINTHRVLENLAFREASQTRLHFIAGRQDVLMPPALMRKAQGPYACDLDLIDGCGHHLMSDVHWQEGAERVESKLQSWGI